MRQRVTYLLSPGSSVDPARVHVRESDLTFSRAGEAALERRITLGLPELPPELQAFLGDFHELHIRIASFDPYPPLPPLLSRLPPGLHVFFTPRDAGRSTQLCAVLQQILQEPVKCSNAADSFSRQPVLSERFTSASTYQFYHPASIGPLCHRLCDTPSPALAVKDLCLILHRSSDPVSIDIDFDVISHAVTATLLWQPDESGDRTENQTLKKLHPDDRLEVGILSPERAEEPEELSLGGFLAVVGQDDHASPTIFSFPARHHPLPTGDETSFQVSFNQPLGLHPTLNITFPHQRPTPPKDTCALHAYWTVPSYIFLDRYQLSEPLFLASHNLKSLRALSGEEDLEAPDWAVHQWGSAALFELSHPAASADEARPQSSWSITIPTHLRYVNGSHASGTTETRPLTVPWPVIFWACEAEEGLKMATNPFDRVNLGYDGLFGPKTMYYHVPPFHHSQLIEQIVPATLEEGWSRWVPTGTAIAVLMGFAWICWRLLVGGGSKPSSRAQGEKKSQ